MNKRRLVIQLGRHREVAMTAPLLTRMGAEYPSDMLMLLGFQSYGHALSHGTAADQVVFWPEKHALELLRPERWSELPTILENIPELGEWFEQVINLGREDASAVLSGFLPTDTVSGRVIRHGRTTLHHPWARYLFKCAENRRENVIHVVDIHTGMADVPHRPVMRSLVLPSQRLSAGREILEKLGWKPQNPLVFLQLTSTEPFRTWPVERFVAVGRQLHENGGAQIAIPGTSKDTNVAAAFRQQADYPWIDLTEPIETYGLSDLLVHASLIIGPDTGSLHLAAALGVPVLGLYFDTHYFAETAPFGYGNVVMQAAIPCCPCRADAQCSVMSCRELLNPDDVSAIAHAMIQGGIPPSCTAENVVAFQTNFHPSGFLSYTPLGMGKTYREFTETSERMPDVITHLRLECRKDGMILPSVVSFSKKPSVIAVSPSAENRTDTLNDDGPADPEPEDWNPPPHHGRSAE